MTVDSRRPYTPETLAERWECSPAIVRRMLKAGELRGFKLGDKLWRIPASVVDEFESQVFEKPIDAGWGSLTARATR
jgi:excisionase family DNA binding protein